MLEPRPANCEKKNQRLAELPPRLEALGVVSLRLFDPVTPAAVGVAAGGDDDDIEQIGAEALVEPVAVAHVVTRASRRLRGTPLASVRHHGR